MIELTKQSVIWHPSADIIAESNLTAFMREHRIANYDALVARADEDHEWWWGLIASRIEFMRPYDRLLDTEDGIPFARWCIGGRTNIVQNALDRHRGTEIWTSPAVIGESEDGEACTWTYAELGAQTSRLAAGLKSLGVGRGDVVAVYMPNINEAISGLLAITKIGAVAMPLFSGFGVEAIVTRLNASRAVAVLTVDGTTRRGRWAPMKQFVEHGFSNRA
jgi:acetyl-CoA synthetase